MVQKENNNFKWASYEVSFYKSYVCYLIILTHYGSSLNLLVISQPNVKEIKLLSYKLIFFTTF